jgi:hypothetical protein
VNAKCVEVRPYVHLRSYVLGALYSLSTLKRYLKTKRKSGCRKRCGLWTHREVTQDEGASRFIGASTVGALTLGGVLRPCHSAKQIAKTKPGNSPDPDPDHYLPQLPLP